MTTPPLPPLPPVEKEWCEDSHMYVQPVVPKYGSYEMREYAHQSRADLEAENQRLLDTIDAIYIYANDTLSGRTDGPDDREWQRAAVVEIRNRARKHATVDSAVFARAALESKP